MMSIAVPAVIGAMIVTMRLGYWSCARAGPNHPTSTAPATAKSFKRVIAFLPETAERPVVVFRLVDRDRAHR